MPRNSPKKSQKETMDQSTGSTRESSTRKYLFVAAILTGLLSYYAYKIFTTPPNIPEFKLDNWWGPYPIEQKKDVSIRPFKIEFSDVVINDLKERLLHRRPFVEPLEEAGFKYGFNTKFLTKVLDYWQNSYNFVQREEFFNKFLHFKTNIQGLDIHYIHVQPKMEKDITVFPLLMLHGWPGSIREFYDMIPMLTMPRTEHDFMFEVIVPSLPGFGFSQAPVRSGCGPLEIAVILRNLMHRVGHERYYIHGGDLGHTIGSIMATVFPKEVLGFHTNFPVLPFSSVAAIYTFLGAFCPRLVVEPELESRMYPLMDRVHWTLEETGYSHLQSTKPDTIGVALTDSPAGLAAYLLEKFSTWTNKDNRKAADGKLLQKFLLTHLLDNIMVYWATNSITTSMRLFAEIMSGRNLAYKWDDIPTDVPTWGIKFKHEILFHSDRILQLKYRNYLHSTMVEDGGHFAAMEMPAVLANDIFDAVDTFIEFNSGARQSTNTKAKHAVPKETVYDYTVNDINGKEVKLDKYKGNVLLIVNVASECGLTDANYKQLNELHDKHAASGLSILAFPCNQFGGQEPGSLSDILTFTKNRGVKYDVFEKIDVNGDNTNALWAFLKKSQSGVGGDFIKWNFSKFLVDRNGVPVRRFGPYVGPLEIEPDIKQYLKS